MTENSIYKDGTIVKAISGFYYVSDTSTIFECKARGNFRHSKISPIVGDRVRFRVISEGKGVVEEVLPRNNKLNRPTIANIDKIIIVSSYINPAPDLYLIDRLCAVSVYNGITPIIVFNKSDMGDFGEYERIYKKAGFNTYVVSALDKASLCSLKDEFAGCVCAMAGNTGVGKSSLLNAIFDELNLKTGEVSTALGRGRHTTRHTELFRNDIGGFVADTPGFSGVEQSDNLFDFKKNLASCFTDFLPYINSCAFTSCTHTCEAGCAVLKALNDGFVEKTRHDSYVALLGALKNVNSWQKKK